MSLRERDCPGGLFRSRRDERLSRSSGRAAGDCHRKCKAARSGRTAQSLCDTTVLCSRATFSRHIGRRKGGVTFSQQVGQGQPRDFESLFQPCSKSHGNVFKHHLGNILQSCGLKIVVRWQRCRPDLPQHLAMRPQSVCMAFSSLSVTSEGRLSGRLQTNPRQKPALWQCLASASCTALCVA